MTNRKIVRAATLASASAALALVPSTAFAGPAPPPPPANAVFVNNAGTVTAQGAPAGPAPKPSCANAQYSMVQPAIDAAKPGQTVYLCGTTPYQESVVVQKSLILTGDPGATIQAPVNNPTPGTTFFSNQGLETPNSIVTVIGNFNVQVNGLTIEGPFNNAGCGGDDFGVLQINGGHLQMNNDTVSMVEAGDQPGLGGCQYGVAIQIGRKYWPTADGQSFNVEDFVGNAEIMNTNVNTYQKNGITVDGPKSQAHIHNNTIDGGGQNAQIARNGVQISRGATGEVNNNSINNNEYTGPGGFASATGVLVFGGCGDELVMNARVHDNTLTNNDTGVSVSDFDPTCATAPTSPTHNQVNNNAIAKNDGETNRSPFTDENGNPYTGDQVGIADTGNSDDIHDNKISDTPAGAAYGPLTTPGGPFLAPIDIQTYPPIHSTVHNNTFDGHPTTPPY